MNLYERQACLHAFGMVIVCHGASQN